MYRRKYCKAYCFLCRCCAAGADEMEGDPSTTILDLSDQNDWDSSSSQLMSSSPRSAWTKLRCLTTYYDTLPVGGRSVAEAATSSDSAKAHNGVLAVAVVDAILSTERRLRVPAWLVDMFKVKGEQGGMTGSAADPAALLRLYLKHGRLQDAASLVVDHVARWLQQQGAARTRCGGFWLPYSLMELLQQRLSEAVDDAGRAQQTDLQQSLQAAAQSLDSMLQKHFNTVAVDSRIAEEPRGGASPSMFMIQ